MSRRGNVILVEGVHPSLLRHGAGAYLTLTATPEPCTPWVQYSVSGHRYTVNFPVPGIGKHFLARGARIDRIFNALERVYGG
jgi:hypothetical protein